VHTSNLRAVEGIRPENRPQRYPMAPFRVLDEREVGAICAYLRTVPALRNAVPAPEPYVIEATDSGKRIFYKCPAIARPTWDGGDRGRRIRTARGVRANAGGRRSVTHQTKVGEQGWTKGTMRGFSRGLAAFGLVPSRRP
jgi:hypothetical protein